MAFSDSSLDGLWEPVSGSGVEARSGSKAAALLPLGTQQGVSGFSQKGWGRPGVHGPAPSSYGEEGSLLPSSCSSVRGTGVVLTVTLTASPGHSWGPSSLSPASLGAAFSPTRYDFLSSLPFLWDPQLLGPPSCFPHWVGGSS